MGRCVHTNNIQLHYLDYAGGDPLLMLLHGLTANAHSFDGLIQAGLSPRFHVVAVDLRGRGLSDRPETGYSMAEHAADIVGLLDALGIEQVVLGGHSFGALVTLYIAAHYPERVSKVILIDGAARMHPNTREMIKPSLERLGKAVPSWEIYIEAIKQAPYLGGWWSSAIEGYFRADVEIRPDGSVKARSRPEAIAEAVEKMLEEDWDALIRRVRQPAILLNALGAYGPPGAPPILPVEQAQEAVQALPDCQYAEIPGNHITMLFDDGARRMVELITAFVTGAQ